MGKQEEKQNGGTLSPQAVSCLPCKGRQWLHAIYKINTVSLFTQKQDFLTDRATNIPPGGKVCSAQSKSALFQRTSIRYVRQITPINKM